MVECVACGVPLAKNDREDHHFPVPKSAGGKDTVPVCRSCHNMIHRRPLGDWPVEWAAVAMAQMGREGRCFLMKSLYVYHTSQVEVPFGYYRHRNGSLRPNDKEQTVIRLIKALKNEGLTHKQISDLIDDARQK